MPVVVCGAVICGPRPLICLPLVGDRETKIIQEAEELVALRPDLLEWRIDAYEKVESIEDCLSVLKELRASIGEIPLIFTCRIDLEGGFKKLTQEKRLELFTAAMDSSNVDIVDIELCNEVEFIEAIKERAAANKSN